MRCVSCLNAPVMRTSGQRMGVAELVRRWRRGACWDCCPATVSQWPWVWDGGYDMWNARFVSCGVPVMLCVACGVARRVACRSLVGCLSIVGCLSSCLWGCLCGWVPAGWNKFLVGIWLVAEGVQLVSLLLFVFILLYYCSLALYSGRTWRLLCGMRQYTTAITINTPI